jgi:hypothetical protein
MPRDATTQANEPNAAPARTPQPSSKIRLNTINGDF